MIIYEMEPIPYKIYNKLYIKDNKYIRQLRKKLILICILSLVVIMMGLTGIIGIQRDGKWIGALIVGIAMLLYGIYMFFFGTIRQIEKIMNKNRVMIHSKGRMYTFGEDITIFDDEKENRLSWDMIDSFGELEHYLYLRYSNQYILLNKKNLEEDEILEIKSYLRI